MRQWYKKITLTAILSITIIGLFAQPEFDTLPKLEVAHRQEFSSKNGYSRTATSNAFQDNRGRLWVSTGNVEQTMYDMPLMLLDGYQFSVAQTEALTPVKNAMVKFMEFTDDDHLWGYVSRDTTIQRFFSFDLSNQQSNILSLDRKVPKKSLIRSAFRSKEGRWYFFMREGNDFVVYEKQDTQFIKRVSIPYEFYQREAQDLKARPVIKQGQEFWFMDFLPPVICWNEETGTWKKYDQDDFPVAFELDEAAQKFYWQIYNPFIVSHRQRIVICLPSYAQNHFFYHDSAKDHFEIVPGLPVDLSPEGLYTDESENIIYLFTDDNNQYIAILEDKEGKRYDCSALFEHLRGPRLINRIKGKDFRKGMLLCTRDGLISLTVRASEAIQHYGQGIPMRAIGQLKNGNFLVNTSGNGWFEVDKNRKLIKPFYGNSCIEDPFHEPMRRKVIVSEDGGIWTYRGDKMYCYYPDSDSCTSFPLTGSVHTFNFLNQDTIVFWDNDNKRISFLNTQTGKETWYNEGQNIFSKNSFLQELQPSRDGQLWITSSAGLWKIDYKKQQHIIIGREDGFKDYRFNTMLENEEGELWIGTFTAGLHIYNPETKELKILDRAHGLTSNRIASIVQDDQGIYWIGTYDGLSLVSPRGEVLVNLGKSDGLTHPEFNRFSAYKSRTGQLVLGTISGLNIIDPVRLKNELIVGGTPKIFLTNIHYYDKHQDRNVDLTNSVDFNKKISLSATNRSIGLQFALSSYINTDQNQFAYKLEGINDDWQYIGAQHNLSLSNLPPGQYDILIKGSNFRGIWSETPLRISLKVHEFFYRQTWFYILCIGIIGLVAYIWIAYLRGEKKRLEQEVQKRTQRINKDKELIEHQAEELRHLDKSKSRFFTNISHELRTPVTLISAPIGYLLRQHGSTMQNEIKTSLQIVQRNAKKLLALVEELLELSSLDAGKNTLNLSPVLVKPYFDQLLAAFDSWVQHKNIELTVKNDLPAGTYYSLDKTRLAKIVNNLLSNAIKFTPESGSIRVVIEIQAFPDQSISNKKTETNQPTNSYLRLQISDTGRGILPEDLPYIFDRYFQTGRKEGAQEGGTGIGLSLSKELAHLMQGELTVSSIWTKGSTFTLSVPAEQAPGAAPGSATDSLLTPIATPKLVDTPTIDQTTVSTTKDKNGILIVEDNPDMQELLKTLLSATYHCVVANNGAKAWQMLNNPKTPPIDFKLIISDVMMPEMDGYELLNRIKGHVKWQKTPVIMLTSRAAEEDKLRALRIGVDDYLSKPFSAEELKVRMANLIQNYQDRLNFTTKNTHKVELDLEVGPTVEQEWLKQLEEAALEAIDKGISLNASYLSSKMSLSDRQLLRRIKALTGLSIKNYMQEIKLQRARHLLETRAYQTIAEVAYDCGFNTPGYFTKVFLTHFGKRPSEYLHAE